MSRPGSSPAFDRAQSFRFALRGIRTMLSTQANARLHALASVVVVAAAFALDVTRGEWLALLLAMGVVWCTEALNTAFEALCDVVSPDVHPDVERAKDVAAAAVLLAALAAAAVGALVFGPPLLRWLGVLAR